MRPAVLSIALGLAACGAPRSDAPAATPPAVSSPAPAVVAGALAIGVAAPRFELPAVVAGGVDRVALEDLLAERHRALLVFYRGDW